MSSSASVVKKTISSFHAQFDREKSQDDLIAKLGRRKIEFGDKITAPFEKLISSGQFMDQVT